MDSTGDLAPGSTITPRLDRGQLHLRRLDQQAVVHLGHAGLATSAVVGLTDLDALTLSLARNAAVSGAASSAATALVVGMLSNTLLKMGVAVVVGRGSFRTATAAGLGAMAAALAAALFAAG